MKPLTQVRSNHYDGPETPCLPLAEEAASLSLLPLALASALASSLVLLSPFEEVLVLTYDFLVLDSS